MKVHFLGTGDAFNSGGRVNSCVLVQRESSLTLLDCGPGTLQRLKEENYQLANIDMIFISHFHADHCWGLPQILMDMLYLSRVKTMPTIIGPPGLIEQVQKLNELAYKREIDVPIIELPMETTISVKDWKIYAIPVDHEPESIGIRLSWKGKTIAYSGDTGWCESLVELSKADLFILECTNHTREQSFHLDYLDIQNKKQLFHSKKLILTHIGDEFDNLDKLPDIAEDLDVINI